MPGTLYLTTRGTRTTISDHDAVSRAVRTPTLEYYVPRMFRMFDANYTRTRRAIAALTSSQQRGLDPNQRPGAALEWNGLSSNGGVRVRPGSTSFRSVLGSAANLAFAMMLLGSAQAATTAPTCPSGFSFSHGARACIATQTPSCDSNYAWAASRRACISTRQARPSCPSSYRLTSQGCVAASGPSAPGQPPSAAIPPTCPTGYIYDAQKNLCLGGPPLPPHCAGGYAYQAGSGMCMTSVAPTCPGGYRFDPAHGVCTTGAAAQ